MTLPPIIWPEAWPSSEGWPLYESVPLARGETRQWRRIDKRLKKASTSLQKRVLLLNALQGFRERIQAYYDTHTKRPTGGTDSSWASVDASLRKYGTTLSKLCDKMALPPAWAIVTTIESIKKEIVRHRKVTGCVPTLALNYRWLKHNAWLVSRGSTLSQLLDEMGLVSKESVAIPPRPEVAANPELEGIKAEIREYVAANNGQWPTRKSSSHWARYDRHLPFSEGKTLNRLCREMDLTPPSRRLKALQEFRTRTIDSVKREILEYVAAHGFRPTTERGERWNALNSWLYVRSTSLSKLCDSMDIAPATNGRPPLQASPRLRT